MAYRSVLLVGCGNMVGAMLEGWLAAGMAAERFVLVDPLRERAPGGLPIARTLPEGGRFDAIVLGIKPQDLDAVAPALDELAHGQAAILSLLAGVELAALRARFPRAGALVRVMPNLAAALGKAPVALVGQGAAGEELDEGAKAAALDLLAPLGPSFWLEEDRFDLVTALVGSGPAFVYRFIEALGVAAARLGLGEQQGKDLALAMVEGAVALAAHSAHSPGELAKMVASKGGVTQAGLDALDAEDALGGLLWQTLRSARDRSAQMAREARGP